MKIVLPPKTLARGKTFIFFPFPLLCRRHLAVPPVIGARTDTAHRVFIFAFFFSLFFSRPPVVVVVDCEFNLSRGLRRAETGNCGVLPNRIVNPTNRTGDDGTEAAVAMVVKEIARKR